METFKKISGSEFYRKFIVHGVHPDGRSIQKIRKTSITAGSIGTADGSSFVKIGQTSVVAGVVGEIGQAVEGESQLIINVEFPPLCSTAFRGSFTKREPSEQSHVLSIFLSDIVKNTKLVSFKSMQIEQDKKSSDVKMRDVDEESPTEKKYVWYLYVDIYCLNYDGNMYDASLIALLAALKNVRLPSVKVDEEGQVIATSEKIHQLKIKHIPVSLTFGILDEFIMVDPTGEEEEHLGAMFTIVLNNKGKLCGIHKSGGTPISEDKLKECIELARKRVSQVVALLESDNLQNNTLRT